MMSTRYVGTPRKKCKAGSTRILLLLILLCLVLLGVGLTYKAFGMNVTEERLLGTWKDRDASYYLTFNEGGKYTDSTYSIPMKYKFTSGRQLVMQRATGRKEIVKVRIDLIGNLHLDTPNEERVLYNYSGKPLFFYWEGEKPLCQELPNRYVVSTKTRLPTTLRLYPTKEYSIEVQGETAEYGAYAEDPFTGDTFLYHDAGEKVSVLRNVSNYLCSAPLVGEVTISEEKANAIENKGFLLDGDLLDNISATSYKFSKDKSVKVTVAAGMALMCTYVVNPEGVITINFDGAGTPPDTMLLSVADKAIYSVVLKADGWGGFSEFKEHRKLLNKEPGENFLMTEDPLSNLPAEDSLFTPCAINAIRESNNMSLIIAYGNLSERSDKAEEDARSQALEIASEADAEKERQTQLLEQAQQQKDLQAQMDERVMLETGMTLEELERSKQKEVDIDGNREEVLAGQVPESTGNQGSDLPAGLYNGRS